jgi:hypothetical protein
MDLGERASRFLIGKFTTAFDGVLAGNVTWVMKAPVRSPKANAFADRFVSQLPRECLDHVLILDEQHLRNILARGQVFVTRLQRQWLYPATGARGIECSPVRRGKFILASTVSMRLFAWEIRSGLRSVIAT